MKEWDELGGASKSSTFRARAPEKGELLHRRHLHVAPSLLGAHLRILKRAVHQANREERRRELFEIRAGKSMYHSLRTYTPGRRVNLNRIHRTQIDSKQKPSSTPSRIQLRCSTTTKRRYARTSERETPIEPEPLEHKHRSFFRCAVPRGFPIDSRPIGHRKHRIERGVRRVLLGAWLLASFSVLVVDQFVGGDGLADVSFALVPCGLEVEAALPVWGERLSSERISLLVQDSLTVPCKSRGCEHCWSWVMGWGWRWRCVSDCVLVTSMQCSASYE